MVTLPCGKGQKITRNKNYFLIGAAFSAREGAAFHGIFCGILRSVLVHFDAALEVRPEALN